MFLVDSNCSVTVFAVHLENHMQVPTVSLRPELLSGTFKGAFRLGVVWPRAPVWRGFFCLSNSIFCDSLSPLSPLSSSLTSCPSQVSCSPPGCLCARLALPSFLLCVSEMAADNVCNMQ